MTTMLYYNGPLMPYKFIQCHNLAYYADLCTLSLSDVFSAAER